MAKDTAGAKPMGVLTYVMIDTVAGMVKVKVVVTLFAFVGVTTR